MLKPSFLKSLIMCKCTTIWKRSLNISCLHQAFCSNISNMISDSSSGLHLGPAKSDAYVRVLPLHALPSACSKKPLLQEHLYEPALLAHWCSHLPFSVEHSSISGKKVKHFVIPSRHEGQTNLYLSPSIYIWLHLSLSILIGPSVSICLYLSPLVAICLYRSLSV